VRVPLLVGLDAERLASRAVRELCRVVRAQSNRAARDSRESEILCRTLVDVLAILRS
jgi:hypothetical protein